MIIKYKDFKIGKEGKIKLISLYKEDCYSFREKDVFYNTRENDDGSYYVDPWFLEFNEENKLPEFVYDTSYVYSYTYYEDLDYYEVILVNDPMDVKVNEDYNKEYLSKKLA